MKRNSFLQADPEGGLTDGMTDIVFLLLIFFIITGFVEKYELIKINTTQINTPKTKEENNNDTSNPFHVYINGKGSITIENDEIVTADTHEWWDIYTKLKKRLNEESEARKKINNSALVVLIEVNKDVKYERPAQVIAVCFDLGINFQIEINEQ